MLLTVPLKKIAVDTTVLGFIANVEYNLTYKNEESSPIEAAFTFPLDEQSAIYRFEAEVEGRLIVGECQGKEEVSCCTVLVDICIAAVYHNVLNYHFLTTCYLLNLYNSLG